MDINDIVREFFGFGLSRPTIGFHGEGDNNNQNKNEDNPFKDPFSEELPSLFRRMDDMFNQMFTFHSSFIDFPNLEMMPNERNPRDLMLKDSEQVDRQQNVDPFKNQKATQQRPNDLGFPNFELIPNESNPRDLMLRDAELNNKSQFENQAKSRKLTQPLQKDINLDDVYAKGGLAAVGEYTPREEIVPKSWSFRKSISTKIVRSPEGVIEEHKTFTDSNGKRVTTVRKTIGDKTYQVTTESDKSGLLEKKEDFINMDEKEVDKFQLDWFKTPPKSPITPKEDFPISAPPGDPAYLKLFKKFFGY